MRANTLERVTFSSTGSMAPATAAPGVLPLTAPEYKINHITSTSEMQCIVLSDCPAS